MNLVELKRHESVMRGDEAGQAGVQEGRPAWRTRATPEEQTAGAAGGWLAGRRLPGRCSGRRQRPAGRDGARGEGFRRGCEN